VNRPVRSRWPLPALLTAALLLVPLAAHAHPFVRGGEVPVDSVATVELAMAHGCGTEEAGGGDPTLEVALRVPEEVRVVDVADDPAYEHELEVDPDDGRVALITWTATDGGEPAPDLLFDAVFAGEPGDEVYLPVFQGCEGFSYRWIGTPDEPADDPAVRVTLVDADPDAPPPAADERTPAEQAAAPTPTDDADDVDPAEDPTAEEVSEDDPADDATDDAAEPEATEDLADEVEAAEPTGGFPVWLIVAVVAVAGVAIALAQRAKGRSPTSADAPPSDEAP
jgi:uncharacterized protein YcnI